MLFRKYRYVDSSIHWSLSCILIVNLAWSFRTNANSFSLLSTKSTSYHFHCAFCAVSIYCDASQFHLTKLPSTKYRVRERDGLYRNVLFEIKHHFRSRNRTLFLFGTFWAVAISGACWGAVVVVVCCTFLYSAYWVCCVGRLHYQVTICCFFFRDWSFGRILCDEISI